MALAVSTIVNDARDLHPALSPENAPLPIALRALSKIERGIVTDITSRVPAYLAQQLVIAWNTVTFADGVNLRTLIPGGWLDLTEANVVWANVPNGRATPARFVPYEQRDMPGRFPAYTYLNDVLLFLGSETSWANAQSFVLTYTPLPPALTGPASLLMLPDDARDACAELLAKEWLARLVGHPAFDITADTANYWEQRAAKTRAEYLTSVFRLTQRQNYRVRDVGVGGGY